jgi:hypothetical protein
MAAQKTSKIETQPSVMLWDKGQIKDRNLLMVLQMAGYRVHTVDHYDEALNLSRVSSDVGQPFVCLVMRVEYLAEALRGSIHFNQSRPFPLSVIALTDGTIDSIPASIQQLICSDDLHVCSSVSLLENIEALLKEEATADQAAGNCAGQFRKGRKYV